MGYNFSLLLREAGIDKDDDPSVVDQLSDVHLCDCQHMFSLCRAFGAPTTRATMQCGKQLEPQQSEPPNKEESAGAALLHNNAASELTMA